MLYIIGIGPGRRSLMTQRAIEAIDQADIVVGYTTYVKLVEDLIGDKEVLSTGMRGEVERCKKAIDLAKEGKSVALISSGDAGVYGMAGLIFEILDKEGLDLDLEIVPGVTASSGGAALLGAPLMNDFATISLSDLLTPWEVIEKRLEAAGQGDFVICLYNPRSKGRPNNLRKALDILRPYKGEDTYIGLCKDIGREDEAKLIFKLGDFDEEIEEKVDMTSMLIIGNKYTKAYKNYLYTQRGYDL